MERGGGPVLGIDFGTTNTVVAMVGEGGALELLRFASPTGGATSGFRSVLSFGDFTPSVPAGVVEGGPWALDAFLDDPESTRLIQSFKTFAASSAFSGTTLHGKRFQFEDLLALFLRQARARAGAAIEGVPSMTVVGRPVVFAGSNANEELALRRYGAAFDRLGLNNRAYAYEPVGAAFFFAKRLAAQATVLVADFGGGTSDFSVMRFERRGGSPSRRIPLATLASEWRETPSTSGLSTKWCPLVSAKAAVTVPDRSSCLYQIATMRRSRAGIS